MNISFRPMTIDDLMLISGWQSTPEVRQWYGKEYTTRKQIEAHYREELMNNQHCTWHFIVRLDGTDAGMIQTYLLSSYRDYNQYVQMDEKAAMVDIFLAPEFMHKGYGSHIMKAFMRDCIFLGTLFIADKCAIGPEPKNLSAIRMYEKAGFRWLKTIRVPDEDEPEYIMVIKKDEFKCIDIQNLWSV